MPTEQSLATLAQLALVQVVDDGRAAAPAAPFRLPAFLRALVDADDAALERTDEATVAAEGDRAGDSLEARAALTALEDYLREGYRILGAIRASTITEAQRLEAHTAYGWTRGLIGRFNDGRVIGLARLGLRAQEQLPAAHRYPADLVADLAAQLALFDAAAPGAIGADRLVATRERNAALAAAELTLARVRFYYCCASLDADQTPELARIGFQPRRDATRATDDDDDNNAPAPAPVTPVTT